MSLTRWQKIVAGTAAALLLLIGLGFALRVETERQLAAYLTGHGVGQALILSNGDFSGNSIVLADIKLDPAGDSTIGDIQARIRWPFLWSSRPFSRVVIDHAAFAGSVDADGHITISGVKPTPLAPLIGTDDLVLNSGQLDLATTAGDLRFEAKSQALRQPDGRVKIDAALWGSQYQLTFDTRWQGMVQTDGKWTAAADVRDAKGNISNIVWSRMSGWLKIDGDRNGIGAISGQLAAGQMRLGAHTVLSDADLTLDGPATDAHIILKGAVPTWPGMTALLEAHHHLSADDDIHVSVEARSVDDLIGFLNNLRGDFRLAMPRSALLTTLLLTPGNLQRIADIAHKFRYDSAELVIDGTPADLVGKIIVRDANNSQTVISMNPSR